MGRNKMHHIRRARPVKAKRIRPEDIETLDDLYAGLNQVAERALDKISGRLMDAGASPEDVDAYDAAVRAQVAMYVLQMDLGSFLESRPDDGVQQIIFDELMGGMPPVVEALAVGLPDAEGNPTRED